jgi:hypothetical protein
VSSVTLEYDVRVGWLYSSVLLLTFCLAGQAQRIPDPCSLAISAPADIALKLVLKGDQALYREGEIIPLEYAFTASRNEHYVLQSGSYSQRQAGSTDSFCISPGGHDPLEDYFQSGIWTGGAISAAFSFVPVSASPQVFTAELNEWKSLPPGDYTLQVVSYRAGTPVEIGRGYRTFPVVSNTVAFRVIAATPEWQSEQLTQALSVLDATHEMLTYSELEQEQHAMRVLRYLGSEAATRELARRFWSHDQFLQPPQLRHPAPYPDYWQYLLDIGFWDFERGLIGSQFRAVAIKELSAAIDDHQHQATRQMVETLALLEIQSTPEYPRLLPYDSSHKAEWQKQQEAKRSAYDKIVDGLWNRVGAKP